MTEKWEATMWNKAASGVGQNGASQGRGDGRGAGVLSGSVFTRGSFANALVSFVVAALLMVQGLVVTGGNVAYATGEDGTTPDDGVRTEVKAWTATDWSGAPDALSAEAQLGIDAQAVAAKQMTEAEFRALAQDAAATVPVDVTLQVNLTAPENQYFIAGDSIQLSAESDEGEVALSDAEAAQEVTLYQVDASGKKTDAQVASAEVSNGTLKITLTDGAMKESEATTQETPADVAEGESSVAENGTEADAAALTAGEEPVEQNGTAAAQSAPARATNIKMTGDFDAKLLASALGTADAEYVWTLLGGSSQPLMQAKVTVPSMDNAVTALNEADAFRAEATDDGETTDPDKDEPTQPGGATQPGDDQGTIETPVAPETTSASLETVWCDNNDPNRPSTEAVQDNYKLFYKLDTSDEYMELTKSELEQLGMTSMPTISVTNPSINSYVATASGLPTSFVEKTTNENGEEVDTTVNISWVIRDEGSFADDEVYYNYTRSEANSNDTIQYLQLLTDVTFDVVGKVGGQDLTEVFTGSDAEFFRFYATVNGQNALPNGNSLTLATLMEYVGNAGLTWDGDDNGKDPQDEGYVDNVSGTLSGRLPAYNKDGFPIVYSVAYEDGGNHGTNDYYQVVYNNENAPNHGSDNTAMFPGGTMTLIRVGTTEFSATKQWLDSNADDRPDKVEFTLWRYSSQGTDGYANASQVRLDTEGGNEFVTITITSDDVKEDGTVNLGAKLGAYGPLPKYDPDGYPYIYALREDTLLSEYETVFGSVEVRSDDSEKVTDTAPNYLGANGKPVNASGNWARQDNERYIYNGGTITNRKTGTKTAEFTKTWIAAAFQSQLEGVVCEFRAQSRPVDSDSEADWQFVDSEKNENAVKQLSGWISEKLTQSASATFPKYDSMGRELEYRWVEYSVKQSEQADAQVLWGEAEGQKTFELELKDALGNTVPVQFESIVNEDGVIENVFDNETYQNVEKKWLDAGKNEINPGEATVWVKLYRDHQLVGRYQLDGVADERTLRTIDGGTPEEREFTVQETSDWYLEIKGLPEYSADGSHYSYLVIEESIQGWHSERSYDSEQHLTTIVNTQGPGASTDIPVSKSWTDGSDNVHRLPSVVEVRAKKDLEDETNKVSYSKGVTVGYVVLTEDQGWYDELTVAGNWDNWEDDFELVEVGLASEGTTSIASIGDRPKGIVQYPSYDSADDVPSDGNGKPDWVNKGWGGQILDGDGNKLATKPRIATEDHV